MTQPPTTVVTATGSYRTVPGGVIRTGALALVELRDPWTGAVPEQLRAHALSPWTAAHVLAGHLVITGRPERALPQLATTAATLTVRLDRPGRPPQRLAVEIPAAATLPWRTTAEIDAGPLTLLGRVREADFPHPPVPGALVTVDGVPGRRLVATRTPWAVAHAAGTTVRIRTLTDTGGTTVVETAHPGVDRLRLASAAGIGPASILAIGDPTRLEHVRVRTTEGDVALLRTPLARTATTGTPVRRCSSGAAGTSTTLARATQPGDGIALTGAALAGAVVEIDDADATELRALGAITDAEGGWRLDGVRGVPAIAVTVSAAGLTSSGPVTHPLTSGPAPVVLDVELSP